MNVKQIFTVKRIFTGKQTVTGKNDSGRFVFVCRNLFGLMLWGVLLRLAILFSLSVPETVSEMLRVPVPEGAIGMGMTFAVCFLLLPPLFFGVFRFCTEREADGKGDITLLLSGFSNTGRWVDSVLGFLPLAFSGAVCYTAARLLFTLSGMYAGKTAVVLFFLALAGTVFLFILFAAGIAGKIGADTRPAAFAVVGKSAFYLTLCALLWSYPLFFILAAPLYPLSLAKYQKTTFSPVEIRIEGDLT